MKAALIFWGNIAVGLVMFLALIGGIVAIAKLGQPTRVPVDCSCQSSEQ